MSFFIFNVVLEMLVHENRNENNNNNKKEMKITANKRSMKIGKEEVITYGKYNEIRMKN